MAESAVLGAVLEVLFGKTAALIPLLIGKFRALWGTNVHKQMVKLQSTISTIQAVITDAEEKQIKDRPLRLWLAKLKDAARDADDILDEFHWEILRQEAEAHGSMSNKARHFFSSENLVFFRIRMGRRIYDAVKKFDRVAEEKSKFNLSTCINQSPIGSSDRTETHSYVIESEVVGRREDRDKIVEMMISAGNRDCVSVLPVVGMGGLGKTTLAQMVYKDQRVRRHFQPLIWVCVSEKFDVARLIEDIIKSATGDPCSGLSMDLLQRKLRETINSKRFLLVLDDVWNEDATKWEELRVLLSFGGQGSVIVATTRSGVVSSIMGTLDAYNLANLSEEECWDLFKQRAFAGGAEEPEDLVIIGKEIVKKFGGLPLAAKTVGSFLRLKKNKEVWNSVLASEIWDLPPGKNDILPALRLSYDHLPSHLKECFAYCAIFPKDYNINKEVLIQLWMANGFIPYNDNIDMEDEGHDIFGELVSRCFFQNVKTQYSNLYNMHDLIHDLAQGIAKNECCILEDRELEKNQNNTLRHVSLGLKATTAVIEKAICGSFKTIHTLVKVHSEYTKKDLFEYVCMKTKNLRALALPNSKLEELPHFVDNLKHLRFLDLSETGIKILPEATTRLFHLQSLKLENCRKLCELPKEMKNMKNLRHLCISGCNELNWMPIGIGNLISLQTLSMYTVGSTEGSGSIRELEGLNKIRGELTLRGLNNVKIVADAKAARLCSKKNLQSLNLSWNHERQTVENIEEVMECLEPNRNIKCLKITNYHGTGFSNWMMRSAAHLPNLVELSLLNCRRCEHLPALGQLRFLEVLKIRRLDGARYIGGDQRALYGSTVGSSIEIFPSLKKFYLNELYNLEEWGGIELREASSFFPRLAELQIINCPRLTTIPHLPSVQELWVWNCPLLLPPKGFFVEMPFLKKLQIKRCHRLALLLTEEEVGGSFCAPFGHLESLVMSSCDELISLPDEFMRCLISLKNLEIADCKNLVGSSSPSSSVGVGEEAVLHLRYLTALEYLSITGCEKLICDLYLAITELGCLTRLQEIDIRSAPRLVSLPESLCFLTSLLTLRIASCENLASLPNALGSLTHLQKIIIHSAPRLVSLPESLGRLTSLRTLRIASCENLESLPDVLGNLTRLQEIVICSAPRLVSLPESLCSLISLRTLSIDSCENLGSLPDALGSLTAPKELLVSNCPSMTTLPDSLGRLTSLTRLGIGCDSLVSLPQSLGCLTSLQELSIRFCRRLTSLPEGLGALTQLKSLTIDWCFELTSLPERLEGLTQLKKLELHNCPKLISLPESLQQQLPRLHRLHISSCSNLGRDYAAGGKYWHLVSRIMDRRIA